MLLNVDAGNRTASRAMDYDWLGMKSEQQRLTTELIETRLTKDILRGEAGGRDESAPTKDSGNDFQ